MLENLNIELWDLINIITMYIDWMILFSVCNILGNKVISNKIYWMRVISIIIPIGFLNISDISPNIRIILCMIIGIIFYKSSYNDSIYKCIMINLLFWLGLMIIEVLSTGIVVMINDLDNIQPILYGNRYRIQAVFISKILLFIELILLKYFKLSLEFKLKDVIMIGLPILSNIASLLLIFEYNFSQNIASKTNIIILGLTVILMISSSIILLIVIAKVIQDDKLKLEYELINERIRKINKDYKNTTEIHDKLKYVYHDLKNHIICMKNYETKDEIISYLNKLEFQIEDFENFKNTGNKTLDIILGEKIYTCKKYNIEFEESINISKLEFIEDSDICVIFANALDNAIEACLNINNKIEKRIEVKATYINEFAIIKFINTKTNDIKFTDGRIETSKLDNKIHGIGIASIKYIVEKYYGDVVVNYSDHEFILKIMIPIKTYENRRTSNEENRIKIT
ncbi:MAG: ATP-binding protein [Peptostreptococcaceae bacterium]